MWIQTQTSNSSPRSFNTKLSMHHCKGGSWSTKGTRWTSRGGQHGRWHSPSGRFLHSGAKRPNEVRQRIKGVVQKSPVLLSASLTGTKETQTSSESKVRSASCRGLTSHRGRSGFIPNLWRSRAVTREQERAGGRLGFRAWQASVDSAAPKMVLVGGQTVAPLSYGTPASHSITRHASVALLTQPPPAAAASLTDGAGEMFGCDGIQPQSPQDSHP